MADKAGTRIQFVLLPYPISTRYLDKQGQRYRNLAEKNKALVAACKLRLQQLREHSAFNGQLATVLSAHVHVQGAQLSNLFRMNERDSLMLSPDDFALNYAYVALGHIHRPQAIAGARTARIRAASSGSTWVNGRTRRA